GALGSWHQRPCSLGGSDDAVPVAAENTQRKPRPILWTWRHHKEGTGADPSQSIPRSPAGNNRRSGPGWLGGLARAPHKARLDRAARDVRARARARGLGVEVLNPPGTLSERQTRFLLFLSKSGPAGSRPETASWGDAGARAER
ncbi:hypothetical protein H1C71_020325, partial [Ictidomys tridecemlineatus]